MGLCTRGNRRLYAGAGWALAGVHVAVSDLGMRVACCTGSAVLGGRRVARTPSLEGRRWWQGLGGGAGLGSAGGGRTTEGFRGWKPLITSKVEVCVTHFPTVGPRSCLGGPTWVGVGHRRESVGLGQLSIGGG